MARFRIVVLRAPKLNESRMAPLVRAMPLWIDAPALTRIVHPDEPEVAGPTFLGATDDGVAAARVAEQLRAEGLSVEVDEAKGAVAWIGWAYRRLTLGAGRGPDGGGPARVYGLGRAKGSPALRMLLAFFLLVVPALVVLASAANLFGGLSGVLGVLGGKGLGEGGLLIVERAPPSFALEVTTMVTAGLMLGFASAAGVVLLFGLVPSNHQTFTVRRSVLLTGAVALGAGSAVLTMSFKRDREAAAQQIEAARAAKAATGGPAKPVGAPLPGAQAGAERTPFRDLGRDLARSKAPRLVPKKPIGTLLARLRARRKVEADAGVGDARTPVGATPEVAVARPRDGGTDAGASNAQPGSSTKPKAAASTGAASSAVAAAKAPPSKPSTPQVASKGKGAPSADASTASADTSASANASAAPSPPQATESVADSSVAPFDPGAPGPGDVVAEEPAGPAFEEPSAVRGAGAPWWVGAGSYGVGFVAGFVFLGRIGRGRYT